MKIRPGIPADLLLLEEIDGTVESTAYLHVDRGGDGVSLSLKLESRPLREKTIATNPIDDDLKSAFKNVTAGVEDGMTLVAQHDGQLVALLVAQPDEERKTYRLIDVRVDLDFRRQGLATAMIYQLVQAARDRKLRAVSAETRTNNLPSNRLFEKLAFELSGIDLRRDTNHDLVKERATLFWYAALD